MAHKWIEYLTGPLEQKKQYRQDVARTKALPEPYATAAQAVHRYLLACGGITDGDTMVRMFADLADLWEQAVADGTSVRGIVGDDPVDFADTFVQAYGGERWVDKERARLTHAIDDAARRQDGNEAG
ncbi:DUF1048 domain-containing protein [Microbacterium sp. zg.Y909]|uniref:DUF1048 domain-containing protein n=1 Tax=Microbacterium sp. zg.Y909 TaxID=2969413 RepID=UPI00214BB396|nr:DUF1048 domain-containing protein [Microbacterium sp. zg.Y909]MCR2825788.1 DUF1048 domain-containing protein [Microbacterium sp. zg.Y909]